MATRKTRRRDAQIGFEALSIEGGLLSADWLARVTQLSAGGQAEADYNIPRGLNLRDEIGRYWRIAQAHWNDFTTGRAGGADPRALAERFVVALLRESLGFSSLKPVAPVIVGDRSYPIGYAALGNHIPVVIAPAAFGLDTLGPAGPDGGRRRTAFGLAQEFLNEAPLAMWGLASDGIALRILRDNASLTRPAWIEADLSRMFAEELYSDFAALWLLAHETRFGRVDALVHECPLEVWRAAGREEGTRARDLLRQGVEDALVALGQGFLTHPSNQALRAALHGGEISAKEYFNQLLRLVYRMIFLLTVEERGLLHSVGVPDSARALYEGGYSLRRLRDRSAKRSGHDRFSDLWEGMKIVFRGVAAGEVRLALPALAGIFASTQCPAVDGAQLHNRHLLLAVFRLSWVRDESGLSRVNWRDMGPEELGSVYESLLELVPQITDEGRRFAFAAGGGTKGNARKTSGSYYTPDSLVQVLLDSALEPVICDAIAKHPDASAEALLGLSIVDPACGSGHFLLAAARRVAVHVARFRSGGTPSPAEYRHALREVIGRCMYGVDLNPMAAELCRLSLWLEAVEPGKPLSFLDHHVRVGNSLLGATPEMIAAGLPDGAFIPVEDDDKKLTAALKKRNKEERTGQRSMLHLMVSGAKSNFDTLASRASRIDEAADDTLDQIHAKADRFQALVMSPEYRHAHGVADAWCAAFVWPKRPTGLADPPTTDTVRRLGADAGTLSEIQREQVERFSKQHQFFHWHLAFPEVFEAGGFDCVVGNPPWERTSFEEGQYFSARLPEISQAATTTERRRLIADLGQSGDPLYLGYLRDRRLNAAEDLLIGQSGRFPLTAVGRVDTYALFTDLALSLVRPTGMVGLIVPTGIATAIPLKDFWTSLFSSRRVKSLSDFENRAGYFPAVDSRKKFCLLTLGGRGLQFESTRFSFFNPEASTQGIGRWSFPMTPEDLRRVNPLTEQPPVVPTVKDLELLVRIHRAARGNAETTPGWVGYTSAGTGDEWVLATDFPAPQGNRQDELVPLIEGKMMNQFDHRFATYEGCSPQSVQKGQPVASGDRRMDPSFVVHPRFVVPGPAAAEFRQRKSRYAGVTPVYRDYTSATNERTLIASLLPNGVPMQPLNGFDAASAVDALLTVARLNAFVVDYAARLKTPDIHLNVTIFNQLPGEPLAMADVSADWRSFVFPRALEMLFVSWDMQTFARDCGVLTAPFRWDEDRRFILRCELDAAFFHMYGLSRSEAAYVMDAFPIVREHDEERFGTFRTKITILGAYDALLDSARTGRPYGSQLDPPAADPRLTHRTA